MADLFKNLQGVLKGAKSTASSAIPDADDFADFATAASPAAPSHAASSAFTEAATTGKTSAPFGGGMGMAGRPYTAWYRIWERTTLADFYQELFILPLIVLFIIINMVGGNMNKKRAQQWAQTHLPILQSEFAAVGFGGGRAQPSADDVQSQGLAKAQHGSAEIPEEFYKEKAKNEYISYATGRQNVAFLDIKLTLFKRYNPLLWFGEQVASFFFESLSAPVERMEATAYCFDGKEKGLIPMQAQGSVTGSKDSTFDGFVFAIVHKDKMRQLRDERYDLSLTSTKDHPKLPAWATVMSESAEVTEAMLTPELIKAVTEAAEDLEALIVSDQPIDAPKKLNDTVPKKRVTLAMRLEPSPKSTALFSAFLRIPDHLVSSAHFRPEAMRKIRATREEEQRKLRKIDEDEKAEDRRLAMEKSKREERDRRLAGMSASEQKKFLEREKKDEAKKQQKKNTMRG